MLNRIVALLVLIMSIAIACNVSHEGGPDSETHFLSECGDDCPNGLECICGVCTVICDPAKDCSDLHPKASCVSTDDYENDIGCEGNTKPSVCDVACQSDDDCATVGEQFECQKGYCREKATGCEFGGKHYAVGDRFTDLDGCNTCVCEPDGSVPCTNKECADASTDTCEYGGQTYNVGDRFPDLDGCNTCFCESNGSISCTVMGCIDIDAGATDICEYGGQTYNAGDTFPDLDGCNTCSCGPSGLIACTQMACLSDAGATTTCEYGGKTYNYGDSFPALDGCNTCSCGPNGLIACTQMACLSDAGTTAQCYYGSKVYNVGDSFSDLDGCNTCSCDPSGIVVCTATVCEEPLCSLPFESGMCDGYFPVFFYNATTGNCESAVYGGCGGNENRFETLVECELTCGHASTDISCRVGDKTYLSGTKVPDPYSCNTCTCENGEVAYCTEMYCSSECPPDRKPGVSCYQCGPDDACLTVETGCMIVCSDDSQCPELYPHCDLDENYCTKQPCG